MKAIIHVDGDAFFASCEVAQNERWRGKPVVTGQEKGMAIAVSYEAKARGVSRGMLMGDIRKLVPNVIILPGNYDLYKIYARRMYDIVRRHAPVVEEYSVDECFADLTPLLSQERGWGEAVQVAMNIKKDLEHDLGITFSLGLAPTKTLAKVASKWKKPAGFTAMQEKDIREFLKDVPIGAVWGIGRSTSLKLQKLGIQTALQFIEKPFVWIKENLASPFQELWYELQGTCMHGVGEGNREKHKSIRVTRTFRPPTSSRAEAERNKNYLLSELSKNTEKACQRLRKYGLQSRAIYFYLKTQTFRYYGQEIIFDAPVTTPSDILQAIQNNFYRVFKPDREYRATGVVLNAISAASIHQPDLFDLYKKMNNKRSLYEKIDRLLTKFPNAIFLTSSLQARIRRKFGRPENKLESRGERDKILGFRLGIPSWGEAA